MTHHPEKLAEQLSGVDPSKPFYLAVSVMNSDGSLDFPGEPIEGAALEMDSLTEIARELAEEHGSECFIFRCVPVRRIVRGKIRVITLK